MLIYSFFVIGEACAGLDPVAGIQLHIDKIGLDYSLRSFVRISSSRSLPLRRQGSGMTDYSDVP